MKYKRDLILLGIMVITVICAAGITIFCGTGSSFRNGISRLNNNRSANDSNRLNGNSHQSEKLQITASFYPMYIIALNIIDGIDGVSLNCMAQNQTGCLHDYQITTNDMKLLETSDIFIINGSGMESFIEDIISNYPSLPVIDAGTGLESVLMESHSHQGAEAEEEESNAHFWLNPSYYMVQVQTVADSLAMFDKAHAKQYQENASAYIEKIKKLVVKMQKELPAWHTGVIVFHDAFIYLAEYLGLSVVRAMEMDSETSWNAGEIAEIMEEIREGHVGILFTEAQYSTRIADMIGKETGVDFYVIDSLVTGKLEDKDSYLRGMESNLEVLKQAFLKKEES